MRLCRPRLPEALGKRVVVDLELGHLLVLVRGDGHKLRLRKDVRPEGGVRELHDVVSPHKVEPRLVLVHRVEDGLKEKKQRSALT